MTQLTHDEVLRQRTLMPLEIDRDFPALACGVARDEGVVVAYIPQNVDGALNMEDDYRDGTREFVAYSLDGVLLDMLPADRKGVKWWQVREAARQLGLAFIEPIHACAAEDFRLSCVLDKRLPQPENTKLAFRQYGRGPWITLDPESMNDDGPSTSTASL